MVTKIENNMHSLNKCKHKIIYAASSFGRRRGLNYYFTQLAIALHEKLPYLIVVTSPQRHKDQEINLFKKLKNENVKIYTNSCFDELSLRNTIKGMHFFRRLIIHENVEIIHLQTVYHLFIAFIASRFLPNRKKVKFLVNTHNTFHGYSYKEILRFLGSLIYNLCADFVILVCKAPMKKWIKSGLFKTKIRVIYNGINLKYFDNVINKEHLPFSSLFLNDSSDIIISYCASLIPRKGHKYLISAISNISRTYPNVKLVLTSDGPLKERLISLTKRLGISENVYFTGRVSYEELYYILNLTDFYVFPSLSELFPYAILEAMAAKKPIVATDVGGVSEAIRHETSGILVPSGSSEALSKAIDDFIKKPEMAQKLGKNARELVEQLFEINHIANQYINLYYKILYKNC